MNEYYQSLDDLRVLNLLPEQDVQTWAKISHNAIDCIETIIENIMNTHNKKQIISSSAKIHPSSVIGDYVYIADNVEIGPNSYIKSYTILFPGVKIGFCVELDRCIIFDNTKASHHSCIGRCIIGQNSNLAFGFVMATRNIIDKPVKCYFDNETTMVAKRNHHGAIIGANLRTGVNVSIMPGSTILDNVTIFPNNQAKRYIKTGTQYNDCNNMV